LVKRSFNEFDTRRVTTYTPVAATRRVKSK
jgi:hypothetical protein